MSGPGPAPAFKRWQEQTSEDVERSVSDHTVVLLPIAAIEQHGPHLPLSTDLEIARGLVRAAFDRLTPDASVFVLPPQVWGASLEHAAFPGTVSLSAELLTGVIHQIGRSVARSGVRRLVVLNTHGGNRASLETAALGLRTELGMLVVKATYTRFARPDGLLFPESEWRHGLHGGAVETSMMMHLRPDLVRPNAIRDARSVGMELERDFTRVGPEAAAPFAWSAGDLNPTGVVGDATLATPEAGRVLVEHYGAELAVVLREARDFPLAHFAPGTR